MLHLIGATLLGGKSVQYCASILWGCSELRCCFYGFGSVCICKSESFLLEKRFDVVLGCAVKPSF